MALKRKLPAWIPALLILATLIMPVQIASSDSSRSIDQETHQLDLPDDRVDGSLDYLANHPELMDELGATPAEDGFINVLIQVDSLDDGDHEFVESLGGLITDSWERFDTMGATVPIESLTALSGMDGLEWLEPSLMVYPQLASSVPAIGGDVIHSDYGLKGENMTIAILDTGINANHEYLDDLDDNSTTNDTKVIGFYDARSGVRNETDPQDTANHGSHVAGIAAGTGGTSAVNVGMAPQAFLVGVIVLDGGGGTADDIIEGVDWVIDNKERFGIDVMSLSLGGPLVIPGATNDGNSAVSQAMDDAVDAGIVTTVAVGNGNAGVAAHAGSVTFPADSRRAITVGWVNDNGNRVISSSRGPTGDGRIKPDVMAPGSGIDSARGQSGDTGSSSQSGSSMSTPHVAGLAALILQANPELAPDDTIDPVKQILHETSRHEWGDSPDPFEPYSPNNQYGWGTVDSVGAVQRALDLDSGSVDGPMDIQLGTNDTYQYSVNYTKTQYTYQGENGDSHNPPLGTTTADVVYLEVSFSSDWPEPTGIEGDADAFSGINGTVEPDTINASEIDDQWVIGAWFNYTGDGDTGEYWDCYPTLNFTMTAPDSADDVELFFNYSINSMMGEGSSMMVDSTGELPDIVIDSFDVDEDRPIEGEMITLTTTIENIGEGSAREGTLTVYNGDPDDSGVELNSSGFNDLDAGEKEDISFVWNTSGQIGNHSFYARISSVSPSEEDTGNNDEGPLDIEVFEEGTVTNIPPSITIEVPEEDDEVSGVVSISGYAVDEDDEVETIECSVDDASFNTGSLGVDISPAGEDRWDWSAEWDTEGWSAGEHTIHVRATDTSGDDDTSSVTVMITNIAPDIGFTVLTEEDEEIEQDDEFLIEWVDEDPDDDASIALYRDTNTIHGDGDEEEEVLIMDGLSEDDDDDHYEWQMSDVPGGEYYIFAVIDDGLNDPYVNYTDYRLIVIEEGGNRLPDIAIEEPGSEDTANATVNVTGTSSDSDGDVVSVQIRIGNGAWKDCSDASGGSWSEWYYLWDTEKIADGRIKLTVRAEDDNGSSTKESIYVTVDNSGESKPSIIINTPNDGDGPFAIFVNVGGTASDPEGSLDVIEVEIDDDSFDDPAIATGTGTWSISVDISGLDDGSHTIYARAVNDDEVASATASIDILVDNRVPVAEIESVTPNPADREKDSITFTGRGENGDIVEYQWSSDLDGVLGDTDSFSFKAKNLRAGRHSIQFKVRGANGLWSDPDTTTLTVQSDKADSDKSGSSDNDILGIPPILLLILIIIVVVLVIGKGLGSRKRGQVVPPSVQPAQSAGQPGFASTACPTCGNASVYYPEYQKYFCYTCQRYL